MGMILLLTVLSAFFLQTAQASHFNPGDIVTFGRKQNPKADEFTAKVLSQRRGDGKYRLHVTKSPGGTINGQKRWRFADRLRGSRRLTAAEILATQPMRLAKLLREVREANERYHKESLSH